MADCSNAVDTGFSQELRDFAIGFSDVPNSPEKYMRVNFAGTTANAASHWVTYGYRIDRPLRFANGVWTYDLWVRPQNSMAVGIETRLAADSGNPADSIVMIDPQTFPLTGGIWQRLPIKITTPVWTPASVGVGARLSLILALSLGTDFSGGGNYVGAQDGYLDIAETSFTPGDNRHLPVIKAPRDPQAELARCLPFYEQVNSARMGTGHAQSTTAIRHVVSYVRKRATPALGLLTTTPSFIIGGTTEIGAGSTVSFSLVDREGARVIIDGFSGLTFGAYSMGTNPSDQILSVNAEI
ncbi:MULTISPECIES: hypothetical protein [unclassified Labrenzia]|uniref:hypothetical protein n=1 Tax=unclassified Labrenzia TaxID=2648686 RepID=UPI001268BF92|nr:MULTISPECIES: hypothetical protein [unclassified Labrenzia]